ncbi:RagB/SusD family nutrient uptake outer membrane protein [Maribacter sp. 2307ULW6-5]|uniref:RagB/SusD family nutrient uptake outer membrane protein n=1 Tax=Maribacter sp. 2307ULW6-5 TaxID=3386275 RepID=UPI0039BD0081
MKKYLILLLALGALVSCENEIELEPISDIPGTGFLDNESAAKLAHTGLYSSLRGYNFSLFLLGEVRSDYYGGTTLESPNSIQLINQVINTTNVPFGNWGGFYTLVHRINDFLANVPDIEFSNEEEKQHLLGQVYGLRAYVYYTMLKTWGAVPISTEPFDTTADVADLNRARSPKEEVMALIKSDLENSLSAFGADDSFYKGKKIYWSKAATLTLKGDVFIWSGKVLNGGNADYTEAKSALEQVTGTGVALVPNFMDLWSPTNENNEEFIFTLSYERDQAGNFYNGVFTGRSTEINQTWDSEGNSLANEIFNGGNRYGPSLKLLLKLDDTLDTRYNTLTRMFSDDAGHIPFDETNYVGSILNKFLGIVDAGSRISVNDVPLYRHADALLLLAEAKNNLGEDPSAEMNLVRQRAFGANYDAAIHAFVNGSQEDNTLAILDERMKEFVGEGKRWWDLRRAGGTIIFDEVETLLESEAFKLQLPISPDMIGRNPLLEQTEGYE